MHNFFKILFICKNKKTNLYKTIYYKTYLMWNLSSWLSHNSWFDFFQIVISIIVNKIIFVCMQWERVVRTCAHVTLMIAMKLRRVIMVYYHHTIWWDTQTDICKWIIDSYRIIRIMMTMHNNDNKLVIVW